MSACNITHCYSVGKQMTYLHTYDADALFYKVTIGQRQGLSTIDAQQADLLYQRECSSREGGGLLSGTFYKQCD